MGANTEQEIMRVHESGRTLGFWLKMIFTLGLYTIPWRSRSWILTDRRLIRHSGVINIQERSIPLKNIQNVDYNASLLGRMLSYGNLRVESAGDSDDDAEEMINVAHDSFVNRDVEAAESLVDLDELIDRTNRRVVNHVLELGTDPERREWGLRMIIISRCLERIGDHAVDIGEQTAYLVTGEFREFTDASHPERTDT